MAKQKPLCLVFDDDGMIRQLLEKILPMLDYDVELYPDPMTAPCTTCRPGDKCFFEKEPLLMICDIQMPYKNGLAFLEEIKQNACKKKKTIVISGFWNKKNEEHAEQLGLFKIQKPFGIKELKELILQ